jgi:hypothetical protein
MHTGWKKPPDVSPATDAQILQYFKINLCICGNELKNYVLLPPKLVL